MVKLEQVTWGGCGPSVTEDYRSCREKLPWDWGRGVGSVTSQGPIYYMEILSCSKSCSKLHPFLGFCTMSPVPLPHSGLGNFPLHRYSTSRLPTTTGTLRGPCQDCPNHQPISNGRAKAQAGQSGQSGFIHCSWLGFGLSWLTGPWKA